MRFWVFDPLQEGFLGSAEVAAGLWNEVVPFLGHVGLFSLNFLRKGDLLKILVFL